MLEIFQPGKERCKIFFLDGLFVRVVFLPFCTKLKMERILNSTEQKIFQISFKFVKNLPDRATFLDQIRSSLLTYFNGLPTSIFDSIDSDLKSAFTAKKQKRGSDPFDWCTSDPNPAAVNSKCVVTETELLQEYTLYNAVNSFENESNPLTFWCSQRKKMPILAYIAATIFVMQASSAESDRHYSAFNARQIITPIRNRLCPDVVEAVSISLESYKNSLL